MFATKRNFVPYIHFQSVVSVYCTTSDPKYEAEGATWRVMRALYMSRRSKYLFAIFVDVNTRESVASVRQRAGVDSL